jgi:dTDP-4-amino-4,6-dideoxygalactose transaminase
MHGGRWDGKGIGSIGDVGSFSFQHTKTMASGEGGMCITNDAAVAERIFRIKQIGYAPGYLPKQAKSGPPQGLLCYNFRATAFQSLILHEQLTMVHVIGGSLILGGVVLGMVRRASLPGAESVSPRAERGERG